MNLKTKKFYGINWALEVGASKYWGAYAWTRTSYRDYGYSIRLVYDPK